MRISALIATMGRPTVLRETLTSVTACDPPPHEVVVVDGDPAGSARPVVEAVDREVGVDVRWLASPPGLTRQRNRALDAASGEVVVFLDDDVLADRALFAVLAEVYAQPAVVGATGRISEEFEHRVGGPAAPARRLLFGGQEGTMTAYGYPRRIRTPEAARDVEFMDGCFMSARRELAGELRFDERLDGYGLAEDEDFSYRLSRVGRVRYEPRAAIHHRTLGVGGADTRAFNRQLVVNRAYLFRKNFPQTAWARARFGGLLVLLLGHRALNRDWRGMVGVAEGLWDALRGRR